MPGTVVSTAQTLAAGIRAEMRSTYESTFEPQKELLGLITDGLTSDKRKETYAYHRDAPYPTIWKDGEDVSEDAFDSVSYDVVNYRWGKEITWRRIDREDDQIKNLPNRARDLGRNFGLLDYEIDFQLLKAQVNADYLPAIPVAPDGANFFATTAAGAARFGATSGNLLTGTGVDTPQQVKKDYFRGAQQFKLFLGTKSKELIPLGALDGGFLIIYPADREEVFLEAFKQTRPLSIVQNVAATENVAASNVTNIIMESGIPIRLWGTQKLAGTDDWYMSLLKAPIKPILKQEREPLEDFTFTGQNDGVARKKDLEGVHFRYRAGWGINLPYCIIKIDN